MAELPKRLTIHIDGEKIDSAAKAAREATEKFHSAADELNKAMRELQWAIQGTEVSVSSD